MHDAKKDTHRALQAAAAICDDRHPTADMARVLITLDHTIALILLATLGNDPKKAVAMLHEGTIPHVEERIALYAQKTST